MTESGAALSEEDGKLPEAKPQPTYNRRQIVTGLFAGLLGVKGGFDALFNRSDTAAEPEIPIHRMERGSDELVKRNDEVSESAVSPKGEAYVQPEDDYYKSLSPEQKKLVDETSTYLTDIYGKTMDVRYYPD